MNVTDWLLYVWNEPRDLDADAAGRLVAAWQAAGGDPVQSPFEPSTDLGWFHRELTQDAMGLELSSDAVPSTSTTPIWRSSEQEPPARVVAIRRLPGADPGALDLIFGLAAKYDLVVFDPLAGMLRLPLEELAAYSTATFWPAGAIRAGAAGVIGAIIAIVAWTLSIPIVSGIAMVVGGFLVVMAVYTFIHEGRAAAARRKGPNVTDA